MSKKIEELTPREATRRMVNYLLETENKHFEEWVKDDSDPKSHIFYLASFLNGTIKETDVWVKEIRKELNE